MGLKVISLFAGAGGIDIGFKNSGFDIVWANDFDENAVNTFRDNLGDHIILGDIREINSSQIPNNPDVITGGFPCQGFSVANTKRTISDNRNFLYKEMLRVINDKRPKYFIAENVKGLLSLGNGLVIKMIEDDFSNIGYKIDYKLLNSADYGVPQFRERVIIIGNRLGLHNPFPQITHTNSKNLFTDNFLPHKTVKESIEYLSNIDTVERNSNQIIEYNGKKIYNHIAYDNVENRFWSRVGNTTQEDICDYLRFWRDKKGISTKKIDEIFGYRHTAGHWFRKDNNSGSIPKPFDWLKLKDILEFDDKYDDFVTKLVEKEIVFEQSLRITNWDRPSDTITASTPEIHINKKRRLSVR